MAKKKKKRIVAKHTAKSTVVASAKQEIASAPRNTPAVNAEAAVVVPARYDYAVIDLKRIGVLAVSCIVLQAIAWYVLNHTGVGPHVYNLIKI